MPIKRETFALPARLEHDGFQKFAAKLSLARLLTAVCLFLSGCASPYHADRGAALGAVSGALAGAAIGSDHGNTGAGAAIGTAVGTLAGAAIGDSIDQEAARSQALIEERLGRRLAGAVHVQDVIAMTQAGLSDGVITTHIRSNGVARRAQVDDLIALRSAGVSDPVIQAWQQTPAADEVVLPPPPLIVEEHHFAPPLPPWAGPFRGPPRHYRRPRPGFHWGVSFGN